MTNLEEKNRSENQEIDLLYFFKPLLDGLKKLGNAVSIYINTLLKNAWLFAAIVIIMGAMGFAVRYILPKAYETEGIFLSRALPATFCTQMINNLNKYAKTGNDVGALAKQLKMTPEVLGVIKSLQAEEEADTFYVNKSKSDSALSVFKITLVTSSAPLIPQVQDQLVSYLENNEFSLRRKTATMRTMEALNEDLALKIKSLDSVKALVTSAIVPRGNGQGIILGEPINPVSIYQQEMQYYREKLRIEEVLPNYTNIEVIQPFFIVTKYNYPHVNALLRNFLLAGLVLALIATPIVAKRFSKAA